ncbi:MAG TPA: hypothetical protein PKW21_00535 [Rhabdaerophilum sp.]|nr:hypothetical protein [Rhabdaerophilum sp.]
MTNTVFENWNEEMSASWRTRPVLAQHNLDRNPLFSRENLARLIETYPLEHHALVHVSHRADKTRVWREGEMGGLSGEEVVDAIAAGKLWLNLRNVPEVDRRYRDLIDGIFSELQGYMPDFETYDRTMGILISSPNASVPYHSDLPGQSLWQIAGRKRLYLYPAQEPYLPQAELERIALYGIEVNMGYDPTYDREALIVDLQPGQMMTWPLNAPHRVENHDCLNISMTSEHWTAEIKRTQQITMANGVLRNLFGWTPRSRRISGPEYVAKAALQALARRSPWVKRARRTRRPIDFRLVKSQPGVIQDIPAYTR